MAAAAVLQVGDKVRVVGLVSAAARHLNGLLGQLASQDAKTGRWHVKILEGDGGTKAFRGDNLQLEVQPAVAPEAADAVPDACRPLAAGDQVRVHGLASAAARHLNGECGRLHAFLEESGRWHVQLDSGGIKAFRGDNLQLVVQPAAAPQAADAAPDAGRPLAVGDQVRVHGLASAAVRHLNGERGRLHAFHEESGRWHVQLDSGGIKAFKPPNLERLQSATPEEATTDAYMQDASEEAAADSAPDGSASGGLVSELYGDGYEEEDDEFDKGDEEKLQGWEQEGVTGAGEADADVPAEFDVDGTGGQAEDEFADLDANELAAAALEAEFSGDTERQARLTAEVEKRKQAGETVSSGTSGSSRRVEEVVEVPLDAVGYVIGSGGERIRELSERSGTRMTMSRGDGDESVRTRHCSIRGGADQVARAKAMLEEAIAEAQGGKGKRGKGKGKGGKAFDRVGEGAGGNAGFEQGICKWFAAGFCRNRSWDGACRNGLHSSEAARQAELDWVALGPESGTQGLPPDPKVPVLMLLDLEGGGNRDGRDGEDEIIEVPVLSMCPITGRELGRFHRFSRPGYWDREGWSMRQRFAPECFNTDSSSVPFPTVIHDMKQWMCKILGLASPAELRQESFLFVTCGNWDVKTAIPLQCNKPLPGTVDFSTQQLMFSRWSNLKDVFREHYRLDKNRAPTGMRGMLNRLKIPLQGQHHLGMDDVTNLAKILTRIVKEGCRIEPTGHATGLDKAAKGKGKHAVGKVGKGDFNSSFCKGKDDFNSSFGKGKDDFSSSFGKGKADFSSSFGKGKVDFNSSFGKVNGCKGKGCKSSPAPQGLPPRIAKPMVQPPKGSGRAPDFVFPRAGMVFGALRGTVPKAGMPLKRPADFGGDSEPLETDEAGDEDEDYDPFAEEPAAHVAAEAEEAAEESAAKRRRAGLQDFLQGAPMPGEAWDKAEEEAALAEAAAETELTSAPSVSALPKPKLRAAAGGLAGIFDEPSIGLPTGFCDADAMDADEDAGEVVGQAAEAEEVEVEEDIFMEAEAAASAAPYALPKASAPASSPLFAGLASGLSSFFAKLPAPRAAY